MSDRGWIFLVSIAMVIGSLATAVWLVVAGQAVTVDGLFLLLTALLVALAFSLYLGFLIRRVKAELAAKPAPAAKPAAAPQAKTPAPAVVEKV